MNDRKKALGVCLLLVGFMVVFGTAGRSDQEVFSQLEVGLMPLWQLLLQAAGGTFLIFLGVFLLGGLRGRN